MRLALIPVLLAFAATSACQTTTSDTNTKTSATTEKSTRAPELAALDAFAGKWTGTATVTEITGKMAETMPPVTDPSMKSSPTGSTAAWTLNGAFLKTEGWHEEGPGNKVHMTEYMTWDSDAKKYRVWYFSENGENGQGWMVKNGEIWESTYETTKPDGTTSTGKGTATTTGKDTVAWTWTDSGKDGSVKVIGTMKRK
jgi:hypothetical protein